MLLLCSRRRDSMYYDLLLKNCRVVDWKNNIDAILDIGICQGKVESLAGAIRTERAREFFDLAGNLVVPGIIDTHMHASAWLGGRLAHKMLARAGVTTAIDLAGPVESSLEIAKKYGAGLNICCLNYIRPGHTVTNQTPSREELYHFLIKSLNNGAIGYKLLGGHYPLSPESTREAIAVANECGAYVAFHAGTLESGSNIKGMEEALFLAGRHRLHLAHINSYCRGQHDTPEREALLALEMLERSPNVFSESYLSPYNGTSAICQNGIPESLVTQKCLRAGGYPATQDGLRRALQEGWAKIAAELGGINTLITGTEGVEYWIEQGEIGTLSFNVNPGSSRYLLATGRNGKGDFTVGAFSSDGGGIPRNEIVSQGLILVQWGALTLKEFVAKSSYNAAKMLGLKEKGHLGEGADADITVLDQSSRDVLMTIVDGKIVMYRGFVMGKGSTILTTAMGKNAVETAGLKTVIMEPFARESR